MAKAIGVLCATFCVVGTLAYLLIQVISATNGVIGKLLGG